MREPVSHEVYQVSKESAPVTGRNGLSLRTALTLVVVSGVLLGLLALMATRLVTASQQVGSTQGVSLVVGHPAPDFTITTWNGGQQVHLAALKGRPVVVNFWASWCDPCKEESPVVEAAYQKYQAQGVQFIGVAYQDKQDDGAKFLRDFGITYPAGPDTTGDISVAYSVTGVPETVLINRNGVVMQKFNGPVDDGSFDAALQRLAQ